MSFQIHTTLNYLTYTKKAPYAKKMKISIIIVILLLYSIYQSIKKYSYAFFIGYKLWPLVCHFLLSF